MLKFLIYAVLAYLLLRAVANLLRAMVHQQGGGGVRAGSQGGRSRSEQGRRASERATRLREEDDIEDARWEDL